MAYLRVMIAFVWFCLSSMVNAEIYTESMARFDDGPAITLNDYRGQLVYLDFWASWCGPCRKSLPLYETLYQQYKNQGFVVVGVNLDQVEQDALRYIQKLQVSYPLVKGNGDIAKAFDVKGMPASFLIDRDGKILHKHLGFRTGDEELIKQWIEAAL